MCRPAMVPEPVIGDSPTCQAWPMRSDVGPLGNLLRGVQDQSWNDVLYISEPIDGCWASTWAAVIEIDRHEEAPDPVTIVGVDYHPCLDVSTVQQICRNALAQLPTASDDLLVAALRHYFVLDGFMVITAEHQQ